MAGGGTGDPVVVGRQRELGIVHDALAGARAGRGGAVLLVGAPGVGTSWVATAAARFAEERGVLVLRGRASTVGSSVPLRALREALLSLPRAAAALDLTALGAYRGALARLVPDWAAGGTGDGPASPVVLAEAVLRLLALAGRDGGLLLVLDDLHAADAETLAVVEYLVDNLGRQPVLLLAVVRDTPGPVLAMARAAGRRRDATVVELDRFDRVELRRFAASWLEVGAGGGADPVPDAAVDLLWAGSAGNPSVAAELLCGFVGGGYLRRGEAGWTVSGRVPATVQAAFARGIAGRVAHLGPATREVLSACAVLGPRFGLAVLRAVTGLEHHDLLAHLRLDPVPELLGPDHQQPGWYAFAHPATGEALLSLLAPPARTALARSAADAVERVHPGLPGEWCRRAAALRFDADEPVAAGRWFAEAGRRELDRGAAHAAVPLLDRAWELLAGDPAARFAVQVSRLYALAEAGAVDRALGDPRAFDEAAAGTDPVRRARLHTMLAAVACLDDRTAEVRRHVEIARAVLGPTPPPDAALRLAVVAAHLDRDAPGERWAADLRAAATAAETLSLADVACQAWQLLADATSATDPEGALAARDRGWRVAAGHDLPITELHATVGIGAAEAVRDGGVARLERARHTAITVGAVTARYRAEAALAHHLVLRGEFTAADATVAEALAVTTRLKLLATTRLMLLSRAVSAAHRGRRREMAAALTDLRRWEGDSPRHLAVADGLAEAFCSVLAEDRDAAATALARAARSCPPTVLTGGAGLAALLAALAGDRPAEPPAHSRWDHQFTLLARAVVLGRAGRGTEAATSVTAALDAPYPMARHLGLRLVAEAALRDGWGTPVEWLRRAEEYFHDLDVLPVASACRALLRRAGTRMGGRPGRAERVPAALRGTGMTSREFEVLRLLRERLGNREIAEVLHLSQRTVEKHVSNLIAKTGMPDRVALSRFAAATATR